MRRTRRSREGSPPGSCRAAEFAAPFTARARVAEVAALLAGAMLRLRAGGAGKACSGADYERDFGVDFAPGRSVHAVVEPEKETVS